MPFRSWCGSYGPKQAWPYSMASGTAKGTCGSCSTSFSIHGAGAIARLDAFAPGIATGMDDSMMARL